MTGAADIPVELIRRIVDELPFPTIITGYGLTEGGTAAATSPDDDIETIATTVGRPRPGFELRIVDDEGNDVAAGETGEIVLRGGSIMSHYLDDPEATAAALSEDGWLRTGDLGVVDERRMPAHRRTVEGHVHRRRLQRLPGRDRERAAASPRHPAGGGDRGARRAARRGRHGVRRRCVRARRRPATTSSRGRGSRWPITRCRGAVEFVDELPLNATGKVMKDVLRERVELVMMHGGLERAARAVRRSGRRPVRRRRAGRSPSSTPAATRSPIILPRTASDAGDRVAMMLTNRAGVRDGGARHQQARRGGRVAQPGVEGARGRPRARADRGRRTRSPTATAPRCSPSGSATTASPNLDDASVLDAIRASEPHSSVVGDVVDEDDESVLVFSSGTTGLPKAVRHTHRSIGVATRHWCDALGLGPDDRFQIATPPSHILGLLNLLAAASAGACVRLHKRFDLDEVLHRIAIEHMTLEMAVAPIALAIANHPRLEDYDLSSLRYIMWGATPVTESVAEVVTRSAPACGGCRPTARARCRSSPATPWTTRRRGGSTPPGCRPPASSCASSTSTPARCCRPARPARSR